MQRFITGYRQDEDGHWVALLDCGHPQHVRHDPPLVSRPWVLTPAGREEKLGMALNCVRCERFELPEGFAAYRESPLFTEDSIPPGLLREHTTRHGVWGKIHVRSGRLRYRIEAWGYDAVLTPEAPGIVVPEVVHSVEPVGEVSFLVEFFRSPDASDAG